MEKIHWQKKKGKLDEKSKDELKKVIDSVKKSEKNPLIEREVFIGFNSDQFLIRLPREVSDYLELNSKNAKEKKYKFKIIIDTSSQNKKHFKGNFEIIKNE